jgi:hypothetical protein
MRSERDRVCGMWDASDWSDRDTKLGHGHDVVSLLLNKRRSRKQKLCSEINRLNMVES